jgi:drug/metabolite transporter (DMT)-like permease
MTSGFSLIPALLATLAAFLFGFTTVITRRGLNYMDAQTGSMISIGATVVFYLVTAPLWMRAEDWFTIGFWIFVVNGLIHPLFSMYLSFEANRQIGPTISSTFCATAPFFAMLSAVLALGEDVTYIIALGTLFTVTGVIVLSYDRKGVTKIVKSALLLATGAAVIRGLNHTVGRFGLKLMPNPFMAGFISFFVAFGCALLWYRFSRGYFPKPGGLNRRGMILLSLTGVGVGIAIWCMYGALSYGEVLIVSPIVAAYPMFSLITSVVFKEESITRRIVAGVLIVICGVALISIGSSK